MDKAVMLCALGIAIGCLGGGCKSAERGGLSYEPAPPVKLALATDGWGPAVGQPGGLPAIETVAIGPGREFVVNGQPFFPIMGWLQGPANLPKLKAAGINTIAGYWRPPDGSPGSGGGAHGYVEYARRAGLYFIPVFEPEHSGEMYALSRANCVLAWIHDDEPDLPRTVSDAEITPGQGLIVNPSRPLYTMFDGEERSSAVIDPMAGGSFVIKLKAPVTVNSVAITNSVQGAATAVAAEVVLNGDGREIIKVTLKREGGRQRFELPRPATFRALELKVLSAHEGDSKWGAIAEVEAFDTEGKNVLLSKPHKVTRQSAEEVMSRYRVFKSFDPMRPLLMTVSCFFINDERFDHWWTKEQSDGIYPALFKAADIPGFDVYPIYGWNQPEKLAWVSQGVKELRDYAGRDKPTYVWVETQPGGKFGENAHPVTGLEIRNQVWQAIIQGATAIGYFTHRFQPTFAEFGVPEDNQKAMLAINRQITRLAPVILSTDAKDQPTIAIDGGLDAQLLAREYGGELYIFAQNIDMERRDGTATISVGGLKAGAEIEVVDENRTLKAEQGAFRDTFDKLAVHVYRLKI